MAKYILIAEQIISRTYSIEAGSPRQAHDKWENDRSMKPVNEETLKGEDFVRLEAPDGEEYEDSDNLPAEGNTEDEGEDDTE